MDPIVVAAVMTALSAGLAVYAVRLRARGRAVADRLQSAERELAAERRAHEAAAVAAETASARADAATALLDALPLPVWWRDISGAIDGHNAAFDAFQLGDDGHERPEFANRALIAQARALARTARDRGLPMRERRAVVTDGVRRVYEILEIPPGTDRPAVGLALDATALAEAEAAMERVEAGYIEAFESVTSGIAVFGADMRLTFWNGAFARLWHLDAAFLDQRPREGELLERLRESRRLPEVVNFPAWKRDRLALYTSLFAPMEELVHLPDGRTLHVIIAPHRQGGLVHIYEDVSDRLALERSYNTLIAVQRATIDALAEGLAVFRSDGRLGLANQTFARLLEARPDQVSIETPLGQLLDAARPLATRADDLELVRQVVDEALVERRRGEMTLELAGDRFFSIAATPLPDGAALVSLADVTDTIRVERALRDKAAALAEADRLKSEFVAHVSYELRTPLNSVIGFAQLLASEMAGPLNLRQRGYAEDIVHASEHLLVLINDMIDLASIDAGDVTLNRRPVDVCQLLRSVADLARQRAKAASVSIDLDCPPECGTIDADGLRLRQALYNLLGNALRFTPVDTRVLMAAEARPADPAAGLPSVVAITISDQGPGIPEDEREQVFERFWRRRRGERKAGVGLGLPLARSLIELHGGRIRIDDAPGGGARITCFLPVQAPPAAMPSTGQQTEIPA
ncbi:MAG: sensor histidine kinase [Tistrella sp.]|uniref:histidine kinase n=1 Tax=Tistrella mobilis TaxID=171437 RepID=A0A3B9IN25_9PROT|nr:PAS domain-containing sensor histidine kinase [Tistrella sp.]MAD39239.1 sensor histidine kinase [Tistrella sp.]MBA76255.1 sensor histidine kinase [Tistrella sp.]HAE49170.1 sensor histidine kinase [Tistrella mobilis]